jgi:hypothetical protein
MKNSVSQHLRSTLDASAQETQHEHIPVRKFTLITIYWIAFSALIASPANRAGAMKIIQGCASTARRRFGQNAQMTI